MYTARRDVYTGDTPVPYTRGDSTSILTGEGRGHRPIQGEKTSTIRHRDTSLLFTGRAITHVYRSKIRDLVRANS